MNSTDFDKFYWEPKKYLNLSTLTAVARCPRKAFYSFGCGLSRGEGTGTAALKFGEALHRALPELSTGDPSTRFSRALTGFDGVWKPELSDEKRNRQRASLMMMDFAQSHSGPNGLYELVHPKELGVRAAFEDNTQVSEYEVPFVVDIGLDVPIVGRVDGIGRLRNGEYCLVEYKTTSKLYEYFEAFRLSPQVLLYNVGMNTSFPTLKITKAVIEALEVSKTKTNTVANLVDIHEHHTTEVVEWARYWGSVYLQCEKNKNFPKFFSGCHPYSMFGSPGYSCDFVPLCNEPEWTSNVDLYVRQKDERYKVVIDGVHTELSP